MVESGTANPQAIEKPMLDRILEAAFAAFTEDGYAATSTLAIARRARVSKRDLYANFSDKHALLIACIRRRAAAMRLAEDLPVPRNRQMLAATLIGFATRLLLEVSRPTVIAAFRLAIAEASLSPEIARALDAAGREAARAVLIRLLATAQSAALIGSGEPASLAAQYLGLLWEGLMVGLLLGVAAAPAPAEAEDRAAAATAAFMQLH